MSLFLLATFYVAMAAAGLIVELLFRLFGLVPEGRQARVVEASIQLDYTTVLNVVFLALAAVLVWRFLKTGGPEMLKEMQPPAAVYGAAGLLREGADVNGQRRWAWLKSQTTTATSRAKSKSQNSLANSMPKRPPLIMEPPII